MDIRKYVCMYGINSFQIMFALFAFLYIIWLNRVFEGRGGMLHLKWYPFLGNWSNLENFVTTQELRPYVNIQAKILIFFGIFFWIFPPFFLSYLSPSKIIIHCIWFCFTQNILKKKIQIFLAAYIKTRLKDFQSLARANWLWL